MSVPPSTSSPLRFGPRSFTLAAVMTVAACTLFAGDRVPCDFDVDCAAGQRCVDYFCDGAGGGDERFCLLPSECADDEIDEGADCVEQQSGWAGPVQNEDGCPGGRVQVECCTSAECPNGHCVLLDNNGGGCADDPAAIPCTAPFETVEATRFEDGTRVDVCGDLNATCDRGTCTSPTIDCRASGRCPPGQVCGDDGACGACADDGDCTGDGLGDACIDGQCICSIDDTCDGAARCQAL
jgi:hypothetical protein